MRWIVISLLLFFFAPVISYSQSGVSSSKKVEDLSDQQIQQIVDEMNKRGLSETDAISIARSKGMSNDQIELLKMRIDEVKKGTTSQSASKKNGTNLNRSESQLSEVSRKEKIDSTQIDASIFGFSFFNNNKLTFDPNVNIPVSESYVIGGGDEIVIDIWGVSEQNYSLTVDRNGVVTIPLVGPINIGGLSYKDAQTKIINHLSQIYSDIQSSNPRTFASVRMGTLKAIRVNVIGEVFAPGTYTLPGTASLFSALYLSGGPNKKGSFRDIQLIRSGKVIAHLDVYDFLINGNSEVNVLLRDNDIVLIPTYINRVRMAGAFKRNGIFESKENETVSDMLRYAGGFDEAAYHARIQLYRNSDKEKEFKDVPENLFGFIQLANGDSLFAGKILPRFKNIVKISGAVFKPGDYEFTEGLKLSELIKRADGLTENAYKNRGMIRRLRSDYTAENISFSVEKIMTGIEDVNLATNDSIVIASIDEMRERRVVAIWGEVQKMGKYEFGEMMTLGDLVLLAGGFKESASESSIEVMRRLPYNEADNSIGVTSKLFRFSISRDLGLDNEGAKFQLMPYDEVFVRFMPGYRKRGVVSIFGQVKFAGNYGLSSRTERVSDLVKRAGGINPNAYAQGAKLTRTIELTDEETAKRKELMAKDSTIRFSELNFEVVSIDLDKILQNPGGNEDIYMENGDRLEIPSTLQTVSVSGEVLNPSSTVYVDKWNAKQYVRRSGGFSVSAKKSKTYVLYPNGASKATRGFIFKRYPVILPGAEIVIPKKPEREGISATAWVGIGSSLASIALAIATIISLNNNNSN